MTKIAVPPGYCLVRVAARSNPAPPPAPPDPQPARATMASLIEAMGLLVARVQGIDSPGLSGDVSPVAVAAALGELLPADRGARLLADIGLAAAREDIP